MCLYIMMNPIHRLSSVIRRPVFSFPTHLRTLCTKPTTNRTTKNGGDEWNDAWETAWLPEDLSAKNRAPWEADVNFSTPGEHSDMVLPSDVDPETKAFVEDMKDNWDQRRKSPKAQQQQQQLEMVKKEGNGNSLYSLENMKKDYRLTKQRVHSGLWMQEIEKQEEAKLGDSISGGGDDIDKLLDSCSEIFDPVNNDFNNPKIPSSSEFKNKPDGWEATSKQDGNVWEMSQREEDILLQEFERRIAFSKFQIASFIKTHIFSRRRPIDGWKYMIEELGPNAKKGKGSVTRIPSLSDASTQPFKEEKTPIASNLTSYKGR
ncbi:protein GAMETE CELL DEFECTIVE 1, mitochondrial [Cornus florida]|uniref:protein GAMETE CELL DEFECTIVE 1, mitochondrial n=1 Tax=Cornus florida TaxID=4283 RepID=UPI0028978668|nr:protein GAMETE CELL DEFECTIVE 1, mitochondrial [Cornus florida]